MIEQCLKNIRDIDPGKVQFYMWIRRLYDAVELKIKIDSIYIKKQNDLIKEYAGVTTLIYTIFERLLSVDNVAVPPELDGISPQRAVEISKEYDLNTVEGVTASVGFILQLLGLYVQSKKEGEHYFIDLFYMVIYNLLYNIHVITQNPESLPYYDIRGGLYVQGIRP